MDREVSFGRWLTLRRKALRLSRVELARRVGCATVTLHKIESDERRTSQQIAARLAEHLAVTPPERETFIRAARGEQCADQLPPAELLPRRARPSRSANLPIPITPLVGRQQEVAAIREYLADANLRLLTLTGAPGIGKTRLALQVAMELQHSFADGVAFIPLGSIHDPNLVLTAIAQALEIGELPGQTTLAQLQTYLHSRHMLLVIDNIEHVLTAAPQLAELLMATSRLTLLITSRVSLRLSSEHRFAVLPFALPATAAALEPAKLGLLMRYPAVVLFVQRARAAKHTFALTAANAAAVIAICRHLDGLPLAIELAAAWMALFTPQQLLAQLSDRLALLTRGAMDLPPRQQTLARAIAWSYDLLEPPEQALLRRLGVFAGGCTLAAAEQVCDAAGDIGTPVLSGIASLVDKSLLQCEERADGQSRFRMLETIREYTLDRLHVSGEYAAMRRHYAAYYMALAEQAEQAWDQAQEVEWLQHLVAERDNVRMALQWALEIGDVAFALRLNGALFSFWVYCSDPKEAAYWLEQTLGMQRADHVASPIVAEAKVLLAAGYSAAIQGNLAHAQQRFDQSLDLYEQIKNQRGIACLMRAYGFLAMLRGDLARAIECVERSLVVCRESQDRWGLAWSLYDLGYLRLTQADLAQARQSIEQALAQFREQGIMFGIYRALLALGHIMLTQGHPAQAERYYREGLVLQRRLRFMQYTADGLEGLAEVARAQGQLERAVRLLGATEALRETTPRWSVYQAIYERTLTAARTQLDEAAWAEAWSAGQAMPLDQAVMYALEG